MLNPTPLSPVLFTVDDLEKMINATISPDCLPTASLDIDWLFRSAGM